MSKRRYRCTLCGDDTHETPDEAVLCCQDEDYD